MIHYKLVSDVGHLQNICMYVLWNILLSRACGGGQKRHLGEQTNTTPLTQHLGGGGTCSSPTLCRVQRGPQITSRGGGGGLLHRVLHPSEAEVSNVGSHPPAMLGGSRFFAAQGDFFTVSDSQ